MSISTTISVSDEAKSFHIYRHWDGSPSSVILDLISAQSFAWPMPRFEADDFSAAIIAIMKTKGGGNIYLAQDAESNDVVDYRYHVTASPEKIIVSVAQVASHAPDRLIFNGTLEAARKKFVH